MEGCLPVGTVHAHRMHFLRNVIVTVQPSVAAASKIFEAV
jgi:hypothetical protein